MQGIVHPRPDGLVRETFLFILKPKAASGKLLTLLAGSSVQADRYKEATR
jgi:hypothetical protein